MPPRSKFTLFPIYSEDQILSNYSKSGSPEKVNGLQIPEYPFLIKNPENCTYYWYQENKRHGLNCN